MIFNNNNILDEMSKKLNESFAGFACFKNEIEEKIRKSFESHLSNMNFVSKEEFEIVKEMLAKSLIEQDKLKKRIKSLEKKAHVSE